LTIPIPLKWYDYYKSDVPDPGEFSSTMLPSKAVKQISEIGPDQKLRLQEICAEIETEMKEDNPKYRKILTALKMSGAEGIGSAVVMPNKIIADAFEWSLFEGGMARGLIREDLTLFYPESLFSKSLDDERLYTKVIFPFIPSSEMILVSQNLSDSIHFIIYPEEKEMLESAVGHANKQNLYSWFTAPSLAPISLEAMVDRSRRITEPTAATNLMRSSYTMFLSYLSKGDPSEDERVYTFGGEIDTRHFTLVTDNGKQYNLRGWEKVILFNKHEMAPFRRFCWIHPQAIQKADTVFLIPRAVHYEYLRREITANMMKNNEDIHILIAYLAEWKKALIKTRKRYSIKKICELLKKHGLERNYVTIRNWFEGLLDDPQESSIIAVTDSNINIGPQNAEDIKKFGQAFDHEELVKQYQEIESAMKVFRVNNQHIGKITMQKIITDFNEADIQKQCDKVEVKEIRVKE